MSFIAPSAYAEIEIDTLLDQGIALFEKEDYKPARAIFEELVERQPENSNFHLWLGRCYGRIAEKTDWLNAMSMAKKTRKAFEKSVELDANNIDALEDLMEYYQDAPGFLGGSKKKAREIQERLERLAGEL